jgi:hypothetical protein
MAVKIEVGAQQTFGAAGSAFGARTGTLFTTTQVTAISQGFWLIELPAVDNASVVFTPDSGVSTVTYLSGTSAKASLYSDGFCWFVKNTGSNQTVTLTQIKSMF